MCCSTAHNGIGQAAGVRWRWLAIPIFDAQLHSCGQFPQLSFGIDATFDIPAGIILIQQLLWRSLGLGSAATTAVTMADMSRVVATATKSRVSASSEATAFKFASVSSGLPDSCSAMALQIRIREDKHAQASEAERSRLLRSFQLAADPPDVASMSCALAARRQLTFQPGVRTFRRVMRPPHLRPPNASYLWATVAATPLWWVLSLVPQQARCKWLCFTWTAQRGQLAKASRSTIQFSGLSCRGFCVGLVQQGLCRSACLPLSSQHLSAVLLVFLRKVGELRHPSVPTSDNSVDANRHIQQSGLKACRSFSFGDAAFRLVLQGLLGWIGALHQNIDDRSRASQVNMFASVEHQPHLPASLTSDISVNANLGSWPLYGLFHDALLPALTLTGRRSISCHVFLISRLACFLEYVPTRAHTQLSHMSPLRAVSASAALSCARRRGILWFKPLLVVSQSTLTVLPCIRLQSASMLWCFSSPCTSCVTAQPVLPAIVRRTSVCVQVRKWPLCRQLNRTVVRVKRAYRLGRGTSTPSSVIHHRIILSIVVREPVHPLPKVKLNLARCPDYLFHVRALRRQMNLSFMFRSLMSKRLKNRVCTQIMLSSLFRPLRDVH